MKTKAYTVRLNLEVEAERRLYNNLEADSKSFRSTSECIKSRIANYYSSNDTDEIIKKAQKELIEQIYDTCLRIISAVGGVAGNNVSNTVEANNILPESAEKFPDELSDMFDIFMT